MAASIDPAGVTGTDASLVSATTRWWAAGAKWPGKKKALPNMWNSALWKTVVEPISGFTLLS